MKTRFLLAAVSCLFLFSMPGVAQEQSEQTAAAIQQAMKMRQSPMMQQSMKMGMKTGLRSFWNGRGGNLTALQVFTLPEVREAMGVSDEQHRQIQDVQENMTTGIQKNPEFLKIMEEMKTVVNPSDPFMQNADEETKKKFENIQERMMSLAVDSMSDAVDDILTPEQQHKIKELQLATLSDAPIISPNMFEALDLTDAQKQQMEGIKKEMAPEFETNLVNFADGRMIVMNKMFDEFEKQGGDFTDTKTVQEKMQTIVKKLAAEDPEFKRIQEEMLSKGKLFSTQFKMKMFDVLTDEQWARLQELTDNPPEYIKALRQKMKERFGGGEQAGAWQPGADSWKPGEAIPEEYRQKRQTRGFPRSDNTKP